MMLATAALKTWLGDSWGRRLQRKASAGNRLRIEQVEPRCLLSTTGFFGDFGPASVAAQTGYRKLGLDTYNPATGYGLINAGGASLVDRGDGSGTTLDPNLTRDFLTGADNSFRVDKPNTRIDGDVTPDTYSLTVYLGDQTQAHANMRIFVQGVEQTPPQGISTNAGQFVTETYPVDVFHTGSFGDRMVLRIASTDPAGYALDGFSLTWLGDPAVAVDYTGLQSVGMEVFPDTGLGILKNDPIEGLPQTYTYFGSAAANGIQSTLPSVGTLDDILGLNLPPDQQSRAFVKINALNLNPDQFNYQTFDYASITAVDQVSSDLLLGFVALERDGPYDHRVYGTTGLAKSTDGGLTWTFLGEVLTPHVSYDSWWGTAGAVYVAAEGGQFTTVQPDGAGGPEYLYVYSYDFSGLGYNYIKPVTVSRAKLDDVVNAALRGTVTGPNGEELWYKYSDGSWASPSASRTASQASGPASELFPAENNDCPNEDNTGINYVSASWNTWLQKYVMFSLECESATTSTMDWRVSDDAVHWSDRYVLAELDNTPNNYGGFFYATLLGLGDDPRQSDNHFAFYYTWWSLDHNEVRYTAVREIGLDPLDSGIGISPVTGLPASDVSSFTRYVDSSSTDLRGEAVSSQIAALDLTLATAQDGDVPGGSGFSGLADPDQGVIGTLLSSPAEEEWAMVAGLFGRAN